MSRAGPIPAVLGLCAILVAESAAGECPYPAFEYEVVGMNLPSLPDLRGELVGLAIADVNGDGSSDAVASVEGTPDSVVTYLAEEPLCYVRARSVEVATAGDLVLLDVTGDGIRDAVVAGSLGLAVLVGDGVGGFEVRAHVPEVRGPIAQLASADLDGDKIPDLAVSGATAAILRGPSFEIEQTFGIQGEPRGVLALDADQDGRLDLLFSVANEPWSLVLWRRAETGGYEDNWIQGGGHGTLAPVGVDAEGRVRILRRTSEGFTECVLRQHGGEWELVKHVLGPAEDEAVRYVVADLEGDGQVDLVTQDWQGRVRVRFGAGGSPFVPGVAPIEVHPRPPSSWRLTGIADVDADGLQDILIGLAYLRLGPGRQLDGGRAVDDLRAVYLRAADLTDDGFADAIRVGDRGIEVLLGGPGGLAVASRIQTEGSLRFLGSGRLDSTRPPAVITISGADVVEAREIGLDGSVGRVDRIPSLEEAHGQRLSWVAFGSGFSPDPAVAGVLVASSPGRMSIHRAVAGGDLPLVRSLYMPGSTDSPDISDLDADGYPDFVLQSPQGVGVLHGGPEGPSPYAEAIEFPWHRIRSLAAVDLELDGAPEIVASSDTEDSATHLVRREPGGGWSSRLLAGVCAREIRTGDVDGDGLADIVLRGASGVLLYRNDGHGGVAYPGVEVPGLSGGDRLHLSDLDSDGDLDLADETTILLGHGDGTFEAPRSADVGEDSVSADLDGDGAAELARLARDSGLIAIARLGPDGHLVDVAEVPLPPGADRGVLIPAIGDYDGDSLPDLLVVHDGTVLGYRNLGGLSFAVVAPLASSFPLGPALAADLNDDGLPDLFGGGFSVALGVGDGTFARTRSWVERSWGPGIVVDLTGDGVPEVAQSFGSNGVLAIIEGNGTGGFDTIEVLTVEDDWSSGVAIGDFDGNGLQDIAAAVRDLEAKTATRVWYGRPDREYVRGPGLQGPLGSVLGTCELLAEDLDGDGYDDLLNADTFGYAMVCPGGPSGLRPAARVTVWPGGEVGALGNFVGDPAIDIVACGENGTCVVLGRTPGSDALPFRRGDVIPDGRIDLGDPVRALRWLFLDPVPLACDDAADANDDGLVDIGDAIGILSYLFLGGGPPAAPFPECGVDVTEDTFGCVAPAGCR